MRRVAKSILWVTALALVLWALTQLIPSEAKRIQKRLHYVAGLITHAGKDGTLARMGRLDALRGCLTADVEVALEAPGLGSHTLHGRDEVLAQASAVVLAGVGVNVQFDDIVVKLTDRHDATADLTATVTVTGERDFGLQELRFTLRKVEAKWVISRVQSLKTFEQ